MLYVMIDCECCDFDAVVGVEESRLAIVTELLEGNLRSIVHNEAIKLGNLQRVCIPFIV